MWYITIINYFWWLISVQVQSVCYEVVDVCDLSAKTVISFKKTSLDVVEAYKITYDYLMEGQEDIALSIFEDTTSVANKMRDMARHLSRQYTAVASKMHQTFKETQNVKGKSIHNQFALYTTHRKLFMLENLIYCSINQKKCSCSTYE